MPIPRPAKRPCVYILASKRDGVLYIGVTSDLSNRVSLHKQDLIEGFTKKYGVHILVYYETHHSMSDAIRREKQLKKWDRAWKVRLIEQINPEWDRRDLDERNRWAGAAGRERRESIAIWRGCPPARA